MEDKYLILEDCIRKTYGNVVWCHKIQEKQADIYSNRYKRLETAKIVVASFTSCGIISVIFTDDLWLKIVSAVLSLVTIFITAYFKSFDLNNLTKAHKQSALEFLEVRNELELLLLSIHLREDSINNIKEKYALLVQKMNTVNSKAPNCTDKAVEKAEEALKVKKDNTYSDDEIDLFLPNKLRRNNP